MTPLFLTVIGGGPAGESAAREAARLGFAVTLVHRGAALSSGATLLPGVTLQLDTAAVALDARASLLLRSPAGCFRPPRGPVILATGAHPRHPPLAANPATARPISPPAAIAPGRSAIVAGIGPAPLAEALRLSAAGVEVRALLLDHPRPRLPHGWRASDWLRSAVEAWQTLRARGCRILTQSAIERVDARESLHIRVHTVAASDALGLICDHLVVACGVEPRVALADVAGCALECFPGRGGWIPVCDRRLETTVEGVFAAGAVLGVCDPARAMEQGRVAANAAAEQAGLIPPAEFQSVLAAVENRRRASRRFDTLLEALHVVPPEHTDRVSPETVVCACEGVRAATVDAAIDAGARSLTDLKYRTRLGMGDCQGQGCGAWAGARLCHRLGLPADAVGRLRARPPISPVSVSDLARWESRP